MSVVIQVREAGRQKYEQQALHDAQMSAVAAEVVRIKAGQQELAKMHWNLQVCCFSFAFLFWQIRPCR